MKRIAFILFVSTLFFASSCEKCSTCTLDPGHGGAVQQSSFCGTDEIEARESLGWSCN